MVNIRLKYCEKDGCNISANFNVKGEAARFCATHKSPDMVDVKTKRCEHEGCDIKNPHFNVKGEKGRFCVLHKTAEMVNVVSKLCEHIGCNKINPSFNVKGGKGCFCSKHKTAEMVNVTSKQCEYEGCDITPYFDIKGGKGRFCVSHKTDEMVDVKTKRCEYEGCDKLQPSFNIKGQKARFCLAHKSPEMVDVKSKQCETDGCCIRAIYGIPGYSISHCSKHRTAGMIHRPTSKCTDCKEPAIWGIHWTPRHCDAHKTSDDETLVERPCVSCALPYILDRDNKCENCNPASWLTARLAKQNALMAYLDNRGLKGSGTDTMVDGGVCGKERPDRIYDLGDKILILECDEHQHRQRACACEQARMVNIGQTFGGLPVYFIRWNPDDYSPAGRKKPEDVKKRYKLVGDFIADLRDNKMNLPKALVSALYMYYDDWSSLAEEEWRVITALA